MCGLIRKSRKMLRIPLISNSLTLVFSFIAAWTKSPASQTLKAVRTCRSCISGKITFRTLPTWCTYRWDFNSFTTNHWKLPAVTLRQEIVNAFQQWRKMFYCNLSQPRIFPLFLCRFDWSDFPFTNKFHSQSKFVTSKEAKRKAIGVIAFFGSKWIYSGECCRGCFQSLIVKVACLWWRRNMLIRKKESLDSTTTIKS